MTRWWPERRPASSFLSLLKSPEEFRADVEELRQLLLYEPETGRFYRRVSAKGHAAGKEVGHQTADGYIRVGVKGLYFKAHRLAWMYVFAKPPVGVIDHINGNRSDNRICNLRDVDQATNAGNLRKAKRTNKVGLLGVTKCVSHGRTFFKATIVIGSFKTAAEAHRAYLDARRILRPESET